MSIKLMMENGNKITLNNIVSESLKKDFYYGRPSLVKFKSGKEMLVNTNMLFSLTFDDDEPVDDFFG